MNNDYNFAVELPSRINDPKGLYKKALISKLYESPWLSLAGIDSPYFTNSGRKINGISNAGPGNAITFGTAKSHDVSWDTYPSFLSAKGINPVYNLATDYDKVMSSVDDFAKSRKPGNKYTTSYEKNYCNCPLCSNNNKLEVFASCAKIGYNIIPRVTFASIFSSRPVRYTTVTEIEITISNLYA